MVEYLISDNGWNEPIPCAAQACFNEPILPVDEILYEITNETKMQMVRNFVKSVKITFVL